MTPTSPVRTSSRLEEQAAPLELKQLFSSFYGSIWRLLGRLGVREADLDDATQEVFWVAARRLEDIKLGSEHSFLYGTALRVAASERRKLRNRGAPLCSMDHAQDVRDIGPSPLQHLEARQARELLDQVLDQMSANQKSVFVLFELEGLSLNQVAEITDLPLGTVSSRLRRGREEFSAICKRFRIRESREAQL